MRIFELGKNIINWKLALAANLKLKILKLINEALLQSFKMELEFRKISLLTLTWNIALKYML